MEDHSFRLEDFIPYRLSVASNSASRLIAGAYESRFGLAIPEWRLVAVLAQDGPMTPQAVVSRTAMDKVTVSRAAQRLLGRRLVERSPNEGDGRSHRLSLTAQGRTLHAEVVPVALRFEADLLGSFSAGEREQLSALLRRLEQAALALTAAGDGPAQRGSS